MRRRSRISLRSPALHIHGCSNSSRAVINTVMRTGAAFRKPALPCQRFVQRATGADGWPVYKLDGIRRVLYRLLDLIIANAVAICEGEKDADAVNALDIASLEHPSSPDLQPQPFSTAPASGALNTRRTSPANTSSSSPTMTNQEKRTQCKRPLRFFDTRAMWSFEPPGRPQKGDVSDFL